MQSWASWIDLSQPQASAMALSLQKTPSPGPPREETCLFSSPERGRGEIWASVPGAGSHFFPSVLPHPAKPRCAWLVFPECSHGHCSYATCMSIGRCRYSCLPAVESFMTVTVARMPGVLLVTTPQPRSLGPRMNPRARAPKRSTAVLKSGFSLMNYFNNTRNTLRLRNVRNTYNCVLKMDLTSLDSHSCYFCIM